VEKMLSNLNRYSLSQVNNEVRFYFSIISN